MDTSQIAGLSSAERAALEDDDDSTVSAPADTGWASDGGKIQRVVEADGSITEIIGGDDDDQDPPTASATDPEQDDGDDNATFQPQYVAPPVEGLDDRMAAIETAAADLETNFQNGDLSFEQYKAEAKALENLRLDLRVSNVKAEISSEAAAQAAEQKWQWECGRFLKQTARNEGVDYKAEANKPLMDTLNMFVKVLADDPAYAGQDGEAILSEAHRLTKIRHAMTTTSAQPQKKVDPVQEAIAKRKPELKGVSDTTVAHLPNAGEGKGDSVTPGGSEFSDMDELDGQALELRAASLSKEASARYLAGK